MCPVTPHARLRGTQTSQLLGHGATQARQALTMCEGCVITRETGRCLPPGKYTFKAFSTLASLPPSIFRSAKAAVLSLMYKRQEGPISKSAKCPRKSIGVAP